MNQHCGGPLPLSYHLTRHQLRLDACTRLHFSDHTLFFGLGTSDDLLVYAHQAGSCGGLAQSLDRRRAAREGLEEARHRRRQLLCRKPPLRISLLLNHIGERRFCSL